MTTLLWSEDFDGPAGASPAASRWHVWNGCINSPNASQWCANPANVFLDGNSNLVMRVSAGTMGRPYDGARLSTFGPAFPPQYVFEDWGPGVRFEASIRMVGSGALWESFWAKGTDRAQAFEMDFAENRGAHPYVDNSHTHDARYAGLPGANGSVKTPYRLFGTFHMYWAEYTATTVTMGVDNYTSLKAPVVNSDRQGLILSHAVGAPGSWTGDGYPPKVPADMLVDYVRVYTI